MEICEFQNIRLVSYPSLTFSLHPYSTSLSSFSSFSNSLCQISEWEYRSYFYQLLSNTARSSPSPEFVPDELHNIVEQPFLLFIFSKISSKISIKLIFQNHKQLQNARTNIFRIKYHLISSIRIIATQYTISTIDPEFERKYLKNRSLWLRNLPAKLLELPLQNPHVSRDNLIWKLLSKISDSIERMELIPSKGIEVDDISLVSAMEKDLCVRFRSFDECLRVLNIFCGPMHDPNYPSHSLLLCCPSTENLGTDTSLMFHLAIDLDQDGYLRTRERHKREKRRELSATYQHKIMNCIDEAQHSSENLIDEYNLLVNKYRQELYREESIEKSIADVDLSHQRFSDLLAQSKRDLSILADSCSSPEFFRSSEKIQESLNCLENSVIFFDNCLQLALQRQQEKIEQVQTENEKKFYQQLVHIGENLRHEIAYRTQMITQLTLECDRTRDEYCELLSLVDSTWNTISSSLYTDKMVLIFKHSNMLSNSLQKLLRKGNNSRDKIDTCIQMLKIEWDKLEPQISAIQCVSEIEINMSPILEKILQLLRTLRSLPLRAILTNSLTVISNIFRRNLSFFEPGAKYSASWFNKILLTSISIQGLIDSLFQHVVTTEEYVNIASNYKTVTSFTEALHSSLNCTNYRLTRLESLAQRILDQYWSTSVENNLLNKDISSFANSCAVSSLELSSLLMEIENDQMSQEDSFSQSRELKEFRERYEIEENFFEMSLEDERSYLLDRFWKLQQKKDLFMQHFSNNDDRWSMQKKDQIDLLSHDSSIEGLKTKRKRIEVQSNSRLLSQVGKCTIDPRREEEKKLREILLERYLKKTKLQT